MDSGIKYRKRQNNLLVSGGAIIALQAWILVKSTLQILGNLGEIKELINGGDESAGNFVFGIVIGITFVVLIIYFLLNYYIGRCAIDDALDHRKKKNGERKKPVYIGLDAIFLLISVGTFILDYKNIDMYSLDMVIISGILYCFIFRYL